MKKIKSVIFLVLLVSFSYGCSLNREIVLPSEIQFAPNENKVSKTIGIYITPESTNKKIEYNEDIPIGSSKVIVNYGEGLKENVIRAFEQKFTKIIIVTDKSNVPDSIGYLAELSLGSGTDYKYWEEGAGSAHRIISINFLWVIYNKDNKNISNGEVIGKTECYKWECTTDNETVGESAEFVLMKLLFVPGYQLMINNHLQKLYTLAFSCSLHSALNKVSNNIAEYLR